MSSSDDLIPRLPNDIALDCLLRPPLSSHGRLRHVCRTWSRCLSSESFLRWRQQAGYTRHGVCLIQAIASRNGLDKVPAHAIGVLEPSSGAWERLPPLPGFPRGLPFFCRCVSVGTRVLVLGGLDPTSWTVLTCVFIFDFVDRRWRRGRPMPSTRAFFACAAVPAAGKVVVAGGLDEENALSTAEVYDVATDHWSRLPDMPNARDDCKALLVDNAHLAVVSGSGEGRFHTGTDFLDVTTWEWVASSNAYLGPSMHPNMVVFACGHLFAFTGHKLLKRAHPLSLQSETSSTLPTWEVVGSLPSEIKVATCATSLGDGSILISGWGIEGPTTQVDIFGHRFCINIILHMAKSKSL